MASILHVDLLVSDMDASLAFYTHFGCVVADDTVVEGAVPRFYSAGRAERMRIVMLDLPGARAFAPRIELMECEGVVPSPAAAPSLRNFSIAVPDVDEALAQLAEIGVAPESEVMAVDLPRLGKSRIVFVRDPDGNLIELVDSKRSIRSS